jgi:hypothetical protein
MASFTPSLSQILEALKGHYRTILPRLGPIAALAASTVMVALLAVASSREIARPGQDRSSLSAQRLSAEEIELRWNGRDPARSAADEAILTIVDGASERSEYLSGDAIRHGIFRYRRQSWDVWFCLRLFHNGRRISVDDVRLFDGPPNDPAGLSPAPPKPGQIYIQVAAVPKSDAEDLGKRLAAQRLPVAFDPVLGGTGWVRVLVGPVQNESELPGRLAEIRQTRLAESVPFARKF